MINKPVHLVILLCIALTSCSDYSTGEMLAGDFLPKPEISSIQTPDSTTVVAIFSQEMHPQGILDLWNYSIIDESVNNIIHF